MAEGADHAGVTCDVADCPRDGTNEVPIKSYDPTTGRIEPATALLCDQDFHAAHTAAINFSLGTDE